MDNEDFVTYEQALALKKLGFDLKTEYYFSKLAGINFSNVPENFNNTFVNGVCSAPTLAQAQKWLRECKDLIVIPNPYRDCKRNVVWYFTIFNSGNYKHSPVYNSYEESLSAGITECLKFLENNKSELL